jgi:hypothetical protein
MKEIERMKLQYSLIENEYVKEVLEDAQSIEIRIYKKDGKPYIYWQEEFEEIRVLD